MPAGDAIAVILLLLYLIILFGLAVCFVTGKIRFFIGDHWHGDD